jgi:hypothetical protein
LTILDPNTQPGHAGHDAAKRGPRPGRLTLPSRSGTITIPPRPGTLTAARLNVALTLDAAELNAVKASKDKPRITLRIRLPAGSRPSPCAKRRRRSAKPVPTVSRSCCRAASSPGDVIAEAGLSAQPKAVKPTQAP